MTQTAEKKIKTYRKGPWIIDIEISKYMYNAWIYHQDYAIKFHMFGKEKKKDTYENFLKIVSEEFPRFKNHYEKLFI